MDKIDEWLNREVTGQQATDQDQHKTQQSKQTPNQQKNKYSSQQSPKQNIHQRYSNQKSHRHQSFQLNKPSHSHKPLPRQSAQKPFRQMLKRSNFRHPPQKPRQPQHSNIILKNKLKIIPLGGLNEIGKNMTAFEYENDIIIIDMGLEFPSEELFGIDYVIPDVSYLEENKRRIRGVLLTHGHLDHIGGIPYILPKLDFPPVFGAKLTIGLVKKRVEEFNQERQAKLFVIDPEKPLRLGQFLCTFFRVAHSIPDALGIVLDTPIGKIVHSGDFKFDETPARNLHKADIHKMEALGKQNVLALFCESTNALKPGHSMSETEVGKTLDEIIKNAKGRMIIASFSSQIGRIQQILDSAVKHHRKIFISGKSMKDNIEIAAKLGYLHFPKDAIFDIKRYKKIPDEQTLILTTGSQGEAFSALARMADNQHAHVKIKKGDVIIISASPIIGNERAIFAIINSLAILGAEIIHSQIMDIHTSGHGKQDELVRMIDLIKPKYLIPVHGEYFMRQALARLAKEKCHIPEERIIMLQNGDILIAEKDKITKSTETVETKYILIDGLGEGHVGSQVQTDREIMSQNGALVVLIYISKKTKKINRNPDVVSRGFIYLHESEEVTQEVSRLANEAYRRIEEKNKGASRQDIKKYIRQTIDKFTHSKLERRPLIIPLIIEG